MKNSMYLQSLEKRYPTVGIFTVHYLYNISSTDKKTDVWSRDFIVWKINFGLWAVAWAGLWNKRVWADYEQLFNVNAINRGFGEWLTLTMAADNASCRS